jgi:predicted transcriptional regulator
LDPDDNIHTGIKGVVSEHVADSELAQHLTEKILEELDRKKVLYYSDTKRLSLLNIHGRVLIAVLEDAGITQRALAQYLKVSESNIQKSLRALLKDGLICKTKQGNRNTYKFNQTTGVLHPDIHRFYNQITRQIKNDAQ